VLDDLERLTRLWKDDALTDDEFTAAKTAVLSSALAGMPAPAPEPETTAEPVAEDVPQNLPSPQASEPTPEAAPLDIAPEPEQPDAAAPAKNKGMKTLLIAGGGGLLLACAGIGIGIASRAVMGGEEAHEEAPANAAHNDVSEEHAETNSAAPAEESHNEAAPAPAAEAGEPELIFDHHLYGDLAKYAAACPTVKSMTVTFGEKLSNKFSVPIDSLSIVPGSAQMVPHGSNEQMCVIKVDTAVGRKLCRVGAIVRKQDGEALAHIGGVMMDKESVSWNASVVCEGDSVFR